MTRMRARRKRLAKSYLRWAAIAGMGVVFQATSCQTTGQELVGGLIATAITNAISAFVFGQFNLTP